MCYPQDSALFLTCDLIALVVQGAGGGLASVAVGHKNPETLRSSLPDSVLRFPITHHAFKFLP
jgi:hypothetical protein